MIPEFFRGPIWVSGDAQKAWEPKIKTASALWNVLERASVVHNIRRSALLSISVSELPDLVKDVDKCGLEVTVLNTTHMSGSYASSQATSGPLGLRVALHGPGDAHDWVEAFHSSDNDAIGHLLGFPSCCREFFEETWGKGAKDSTLQMAGSDGPNAINIMLRWLNVRLVPHLPCSFDCRKSLDFAADMVQLAHSLDLIDQVETSLSLLGLPMQYSALHGAMQLVTPVFKFAASTDYTAKKITKERKGKFTELTPIVLSDEELEARVNGFTSKDVMNDCHDLVLGGARCVENSDPVLDLGCGDGTLAGMVAGYSAVPVYGVDLSADAILAAHKKFPGAKDNFWVDKFQYAFDRNDVMYGITLLMPGRLVEMKDSNKTKRFLDVLFARSKVVIAYAYSDWLKDQSIEELCKKAGISRPPDFVLQNTAPKAGVAVYKRRQV